MAARWGGRGKRGGAASRGSSVLRPPTTRVVSSHHHPAAGGVVATSLEGQGSRRNRGGLNRGYSRGRRGTGTSVTPAEELWTERLMKGMAVASPLGRVSRPLLLGRRRRRPRLVVGAVGPAGNGSGRAAVPVPRRGHRSVVRDPNYSRAGCKSDRGGVG